jgi:hypothetical protein
VPSIPARFAYTVRAFWSFLAFARFLKGGIGLFIWAQNKHFRGGLGALIMKSTSSTRRERKPDPEAWLPMPIRDMSPISTGLPGRTDHLFGLPINEKVAVIPHGPLLLMTNSCLGELVQQGQLDSAVGFLRALLHQHIPYPSDADVEESHVLLRPHEALLGLSHLML